MGARGTALEVALHHCLAVQNPCRALGGEGRGGEEMKGGTVGQGERGIAEDAGMNRDAAAGISSVATSIEM